METHLLYNINVSVNKITKSNKVANKKVAWILCLVKAYSHSVPTEKASTYNAI